MTAKQARKLSESARDPKTIKDMEGFIRKYASLGFKNVMFIIPERKLVPFTLYLNSKGFANSSRTYSYLPPLVTLEINW